MSFFVGFEPAQVGLLFDLPRRTKKRSAGVNVWCIAPIHGDYRAC